MSAKNSAKKPLAFNEANEVLYDAFQAVQMPDYFPTDPPWPEWNDTDINAETWGNGNKIKPQTTTKGTGKLEAEQTYYFDAEQCRFPPELEKHIASWKRPHEVFPQDKLAICSGMNTVLPLKSPSEYTHNWDLFKVVCDIFCILHYYAAMEPFPTEGETPYYAPNTRGQPWQPWHHIYGNCKTGREQPHRPVYYGYGKYILRLYYFGAWRKFVVDDLIPCDVNGKCMLPVTQNPGELWPILLVKGILKITSLTPTFRVDQMDIPIWTLFTGWAVGSYPTWNKTVEQTWRLIYSLTPHFVLAEHAEKEKVESRMASISSKGTAKKPVERKESKSDQDRPLLTIAELSNFPPECELYGDSYPVAILMTRDIPLKKYVVRKSTEQWKRIRWVQWAASKGLWTDEKLIPPYRCLYQINFFRKLYDLLSTDPEIENRLFVLDEGDDDAIAHKDPPDGPLQWVDYYKFIQYISNLTLLIRPSSLMANYKLTYITLGPSYNAGAGGGKGPKAAASNEQLSYYMQPTVKLCGNEPPILYCESLTGIFIFFCLWVYPYEQVDNRSYLSIDQPECIKVYHGSVIVEKYDWRSTPQNSIVASVKTVGNNSTSLFLSPGRHAFRIWLDTDSPFLIEIYSNTEITVGKGPKIRFLMSMESLAITDYVNRVSNAFIELVQKFGRFEHSKLLSQFYNMIKPRNSIKPGYEMEMNYFIDAFAISVLTVLKSIVSNEEELRWMTIALRSLFINPSIPLPKVRAGASGNVPKRIRKEPMTAVSTDRRERTLSDVISHVWTSEEINKAIVIQKMFRGFQIRQLVHYGSPNSKEYKILVEKLKRICDVMFASNRREVEVARLIRETITVRSELLPTFLFCNDIPNVTVTEEFTGRITGVEPKAWVPMIRFTFVCHSPDPLPCAFYLSCNLEQYTVSVTDNDTNEEIFRLVNATCPHWYNRNQTGYTIFVYGWNESDMKTVNWRLEMVKMKYFLDIHPCNPTAIAVTGNYCNPYQPQPLSVLEVRNFYVPNKQNKICTCLIKVRKRLSVTIRLSVSFEDARFFARIHPKTDSGYSDSEVSYDGMDSVVEAEAKSSAIIFSSVFLEHYPKSRVTVDSKEEQNDQTVYVLEAFVANHSWPLTKHEWGVVEPIRVNGENGRESMMNMSQSRKSSTSSRRRSLRTSKSGVQPQKAVESPYWYLQVVTDSSPDLTSVLEVTEDRSYPDMIKGMKLSWEENDTGRRQRGITIQRDFLRSIFDESRKYSNVESDDVSNDIKNYEGDTSVDDSFEVLLHEMRSFSYLVNDKSQERYVKSPRILPWTPMNELISKYSHGKFGVDLMSLHGSSKNFLGEDYEIPHVPELKEEVLEMERKKLLNEIRRQRLVLEDNFVRENNLSANLMDQAYENRKKIIEKMKVLKGNVDSKSDDGKNSMVKINK